MSSPSPTVPFFDVRLRGFPTRTPVDAVTALIRSRVRPLTPEAVSLDAAGRVLAQEVVAAYPVPHFDRALFDGYAVRAVETHSLPSTFRVLGEALPGRPSARAVGTGEAVRIMTGSPMPAGADAVIPFEKTSESAGQVTVRESIATGRNVGRIGEDVAAGQWVLPKGRVLRPQDLGLLSSIGVGTVNVIRQPRVLILVTGDEILPPGSRPEGFQIVDSNSVVLRALATRDGGLVLPRRHVPDRPELIREVMSSSDWDVLLVSGGTSVGREDHAPKLVAELGELPVHGIAIRPAGPTGVGFIGGRPVFLLPGNPVACLCAYDLFAGQAVRLLGGRSPELPYRQVECPVAAAILSAVGRTEYVRVTDSPEGVKPVATRGASILSSTVVADGFVLVPPEKEGVAPGETVRLYRYDG
jgi:molybdopterin molybdotransferase